MKQHRTGLCELVVMVSGSDDPLISCNAFILNSGLRIHDLFSHF